MTYKADKIPNLKSDIEKSAPTEPSRVGLSYDQIQQALMNDGGHRRVENEGEQKFSVALKETNRGFLVGEFRDRDGISCSIQESSAAGRLWLGMDNGELRRGPNYIPTESPEPLPDEIASPFYRPPHSARMHLTGEMAAALIPLLQRFVETGGLDEKEKPKKKQKFPIELKEIDRGFLSGSFYDDYGALCSIEESTVADKRSLWVGVNDAYLSYGSSYTGKADINPNYIPMKTPKGAPTTTRMHLTGEMVAALIPLLQHFVETGSLFQEGESYPSYHTPKT